MAAKILYDNLADATATTITASTALTLTPVQQRLQNPHVGRKWRSTGNAEYIIADLGSSQSIDTVALLGVSGSDPTTRIRLSTADASGAAGDAHDSGAATGRIDSGYGDLIYLLPAAASGRYVRIDVSEGGVDYIEVGRLVIGLLTELTLNYALGWSRQWVDRSRKTEGRGGQTFFDEEDSYRVLDVTFDALTEAERTGLVETIDRVNGEHRDILFVADPSSSNLGRDSIWGLLDGIQPVLQPTLTTPARYSKSYRIRERL